MLAVNVLSPSSLLSSLGAPGPFAIVFADNRGAMAGAPGALIAPAWRATAVHPEEIGRAHV